MFGFSLTKILFTLAAVIAIWYGFKWLGRVQANQGVGSRGRVRGGKPPKRDTASRRAASSDDSESDIEDMIACPTCGDFVAARGARGCGRDNCPYPV